MRRSDSKIKKDILESLIFNGPLKLTNISCSANISCNKLKILIDDLKENKFIIERNKKNDYFYSITSEGLNFYKECSNQVLIVK